MIHLRPNAIIDCIPLDNGGEKLTIKCSIHQAFLYFKQFGADAKILEPEILVKKYEDFYYGAYKALKQK